MEILVIAILVALAAVITGTVWMQKSKWKTVYEEHGMSDEVSERYGLLQDQNVRCRLHQVSQRVGNTVPGAGVGAGMVADEGPTKVQLQVHKNDLEKAEHLLNSVSVTHRGIL